MEIGDFNFRDKNYNEAQETYGAYLKILPNGPLSERARKVLERLGKKSVPRG